MSILSKRRKGDFSVDIRSNRPMRVRFALQDRGNRVTIDLTDDEDNGKRVIERDEEEEVLEVPKPKRRKVLVEKKRCGKDEKQVQCDPLEKKKRGSVMVAMSMLTQRHG